MKDNIEKSLKRWLKKKVKITLALITTFLITGSIGYAEDLNRDTILHTDGKGEYTGENITITSKKEGVSGIKDGIWMEMGAEVIVSGKNITIDTQTNSGNDGIHFEKSGGKITVKDFDNLTIKTGQNGSKGTYGMVSNKNGDITITGRNDNSKLIILSSSSSSSWAPHGAISTGTVYGGGKINIDVGSIDITCNNDEGIQIFTTTSKADFTIDTKKINIKAKKGVTVGGYEFFPGYGKITSNSIDLDTTEEGILNTRGELELKTGGILISNSKIGISSKNNYGEKAIIEISNKNEEEQTIVTNDENIKNGLNITAKEKGLNAIKGTITADFTGADIGITTKNTNKESYGIFANAGTINLTGNTLNINSTGKEIEVSEQFNYNNENNFTVSKLFNTTQGIRLEDEAKLNLVEVKNLSITSSDIAVTANNSNFTFNGNGYFKGNSYLIDGYIGEHLLVRPVIQAVDNGKINLSGDTTVISNTGHDGIDRDRVNNVGIYAQGHTDKNSEGNSTINITGNLTVISGNDNFTSEKYSYNDIYNKQKAKEIIENSDIALMATTDGDIKVDSDNSSVLLIGDIIAGRKGSTIDIKGGKKEINETPSMVVVGEVLAANGGKVHLDMSNGGYFVGRVDDYFEIEEFKKEEIDFRNDKFTKDIESDGEVTINLGNNAMWNVLGQSFITNLNFAEGGGVVDLTHDGNALRIKNLSGEGTFNLTLNADNKSLGNMLYIYDVDNGIEVMSLGENQDNQSKVLTQKVNLTDSILELDYGEKLRFATLSKEAHGKVEFKVNEVKEKGINDVSFETRYEDYNHEAVEENIVYNGEKASNKKPGDKLVSGKKVNTENTLTTLEVTLSDEETNTLEEEKFDASQNWYLTRLGEDLNDGGKTVIEMSRANYASAVYMDNLNKRLGDMSFVDGNEGIWTRIRNDRVGEDEEYRLRNNMYQIGYDKTYPMDDGEGNEYRGIALEYTEGTMEYKNIIGEADVDRVALWLYDTNVYNDGFYSDYVFRIGRMSSNFSINGRETGAKVEGDFRNLFLGASAEFGKRYDLTEKTYFEPQVQLQYTYIDDADYTTNQGTKVDYSDIHSLIGRVGFRLGHDFYNDNGKDNTIYLKADVNHEFLGEQDINAVDMTGSLGEEFRNYKNKGTWFDVGIGAAKNMTENLYVYADIERQFGHRDDNSWQFNLGFRYKFSSLKDFSLTNLFDFDKSEIKPEGKEEIAKISKELNKKKYKGTLKLEGHTDWTGTREYNQGLSERRVKAVEEELKKNVTNEKLKYETKGYGEDRPVADNRTKEGRALNRRVEVKYEK